MPKPVEPDPFEPTQLPLFPEEASLVRIRPERNEWRYYRMEIWKDLFGGALLARHWGRIGTPGRVRLDRHPDAGRSVIHRAGDKPVRRRRKVAPLPGVI